MSDNAKATVCWSHAQRIKFIHFEYHITLCFYTVWLLYKVWFITIPLCPNSLPLQHFIVVVLLYPISVLLKKLSLGEPTCSSFWLQSILSPETSFFKGHSWVSNYLGKCWIYSQSCQWNTWRPKRKGTFLFPMLNIYEALGQEKHGHVTSTCSIFFFF